MSSNAIRRPSRDYDLTTAAQMADVDGDGDLDLVIANRSMTPTSGARTRLYLNDGSGTFTEVTATHVPDDDHLSTYSLAVGDVDDDGDLDVVFGNYLVPNRVYLNDGRGSFQYAYPARMPSQADDTSAMALEDLDGDLDLVSASDFDQLRFRGGHDRVYANLLRHVDTPFLAAVGRGYRLDVYARHGPPRAIDFALIHVSTGRARIPVPPFGVFGLDPATSIALPPMLIHASTGVGTFVTTLPNDPNLVGRSLHAQALLLHWPGATGHLTNVVSDTVLR